MTPRSPRCLYLTSAAPVHPSSRGIITGTPDRRAVVSAFSRLALSVALDSGAAVAGPRGRVGLVIGIDRYVRSPLKNAARDAEAIKAKLTHLGWDAELVLNPTRRQLATAFHRLGERAIGAEASLVFYAGHAVDVAGKDWLFPVDARVSDERDLRFEGLEVDSVLEQMKTSRVSIAIFDSCHNNPFLIDRNLSRGLARIDPPASGWVIAFAAAPGEVSSDGTGLHSPFTRSLLDHIDSQVDIRTVMKRVQQDVMDATYGQQHVWVNDSMLDGNLILAQSAEPETVVSRRQLPPRKTQVAQKPGPTTTPASSTGVQIDRTHSQFRCQYDILRSGQQAITYRCGSPTSRMSLVGHLETHRHVRDDGSFRRRRHRLRTIVASEADCCY